MLDLKFKSFIARLNSARKTDYSKDFLVSIKEEEADALIDRILGNKELYAQIQKLTPNQAIRFERLNINSRVSSIVKTPDGEYQFIVEPKKKGIRNGKRKDCKTFAGGVKTGKPAWRLDSEIGPIPTISLQNKISKKKKKAEKVLGELKKEVAFAWKLPQSEYLVRPVLGALYTNKKGRQQQTIFAPQGIPLDELEEHGIKLTPAEQDIVGLQLCAAVAFIHQQGYVYQDLKLNNAVLFRDPQGNIRVSLIDPGMVSGKDYDCEIAGTHGYESPEVALASVFEEEYEEDGDTLGKICADRIEKAYKKQPKKLEDLKKFYDTPHTANDVWSLGIMLWKLFHKDKEPLALPKGEPFKAFLTMKRADRLQTGADALKYWQKYMAKKVAKASTKAAPLLTQFEASKRSRPVPQKKVAVQPELKRRRVVP